MAKTIIYSCVFCNQKYINLINLLLKSYKLFGNSSDDIDYLIICSPDFQNVIQVIFNNLNLNGKIWCLDLKTKFESAYSRLKIFDYPNINTYHKILYLDCDILVTNSINNILDFELDNKLYVLKEGNTNHDYWGAQFFDNNPNCSSFTTGILLFNNNAIIKDLFSKILLHISNHIDNNLDIPVCLDQPFIVYHAFKNNIYNNTKLINLVVNNPVKFSGETISHFPGGPGHYESKIVKMISYMSNIMFNLDEKRYLKNVDNENILCVTASNVYNTQKMRYILESCIFQNIELRLIGLNKSFSWIKRLKYYIEELNKIQYENTIIVFTNAYDVFYNDNLDVIKRKFLKMNAGIVFSCEKLYSHQVSEKKLVYDKNAELYGNNSKYRYICAGCYMGYKKYLLYLLSNILNEDFIEKVKNSGGKGSDDQCLLGYYLSENYDNVNYKLDYNCDIFYTPTEDWNDKNACIDNMNKFKSSIIHVPYKSKYNHILTALFNYKYNKLLNKKYKWGDSTITFLENGKMRAFGLGKFHFINTYLLKCDFGGREHLLKFNQDYSAFISVRKDDFEIVSGHHL